MKSEYQLDHLLERIFTKIGLGMKLKADIELQNVLNNRPEEMDVWYMLGELYYEAGFIDAAGKYWLFYPSNEIRVVKSVDLYRESMNFSASRILKDVKFRGVGKREHRKQWKSPNIQANSTWERRKSSTFAEKYRMWNYSTCSTLHSTSTASCNHTATNTYVQFACQD